MDTKTCVRCDATKTTDQFLKQRRTCIECARQRAREYMRSRREADPEREREAVRRHRRNNPDRVYAWNQKKQLAPFGLTWTTYNELLAKQNGHCAICPRTEPGGKGRWHVDHDHRCCGRKRACDKCRRGLLCFNCNIALGYLGDDPQLLVAALAYLTSYQQE